MGGKKVRIKRPPTIDGIPQEEWIERNADPIWLHQNEMWDILEARASQELSEKENELEF